MKYKFAIILSLAATTLTVGAHDRVVPLVFNIKATGEVQSSGSTVNDVTTTPGPARFSVTSASLLQNLAAGEFHKGNYPSNSFPAGAKLVLMYDASDVGNSSFAVEDGAGGLLVDVSDLLEFDAGSTPVMSGSVNHLTGLITKINETFYATISYDDTGAGGSQKFFLSGLVTASGTDSKVVAGATTEKWSVKMSGPGAGTLDGKPAVISGGVTATGSQAFIVP